MCQYMSYSGKSWSSARARMARSRAELICSSAGRPFGLTQLDWVMPRFLLVVFISAEKFSTEPDTPSASTTAMSLADFTIRIFSALSTVILVPGLKPIFDGGCEAARGGHGEQSVERDALGFDRLQRHIDGHQLGGRRRVPRHRGVLGVQHLAGLGVHQQRRLGPARAGEAAVRMLAARAAARAGKRSVGTNVTGRSGLLFAGLGTSVVSLDVWNI